LCEIILEEVLCKRAHGSAIARVFERERPTQKERVLGPLFTCRFHPKCRQQLLQKNSAFSQVRPGAGNRFGPRRLHRMQVDAAGKSGEKRRV